MLPQYLWIPKITSPAVPRRPCFLGVLHPSWLLQSFCLILGLEGRDLIEMPHFVQLFWGLSLFIHCPIAVLHLCSYLLQEEASLMMAEWDTDPWVEQNVIRSHFIAAFLRRRAVFDLSQVLGQPQRRILSHGGDIRSNQILVGYSYKPRDSMALVHLASRSLLKTEELVVVMEFTLLW